MKKIGVLILFLILGIKVSVGQSSRDTLHTKVGFTAMIESQHLEDQVKLFIHHPFCYKSEREFPVIVLLDANSTFKSFSACAELMAYDHSIPPCIVVGFPQYKYTDFDKGDLEGKMDKLSLFIQDELFPYLKSNYNISKTIVWGQGPGSGLISSYLMLESPDLFDGYISDVPDFSLIADKAYSKNAFDKLQDKQIDYYLFGSQSENLYNEAFLNNLKANAPQGLNWHYTVNDEPNMIIYFLNNYMLALELFFKEKGEG